MEDTEVLAEEQTVLDDHENKVDYLIEPLEDLVATTEPVRRQAFIDHWEAANRVYEKSEMAQVLENYSLDKAKGTIRLLEPTPCLDT